MSDLDNLNTSKVFVINEETIAEAFLEYYNDVPFINIYVDVVIPALDVGFIARIFN